MKLGGSIRNGGAPGRRLGVLFALFLLSVIASYAQFTANDSVQELLNGAEGDSARVDILNALASSLLGSNNDKAIEYGQEANELAERLKYQEGEAYALKNIGLGYFSKSDFVEAFRAWDEALLIFKILGDDAGISNITGNLGSVYLLTGKTVEAVESYLQALDIAEKQGDSTRIASNLSNIGLAYSKQTESLDSARVYYRRSLAIYESIGPDNMIGAVALNLGEVYYNQEAYDTALVYFERTLSLFSNRIYKAKSLIYLGNIYTELRAYQTALDYYEQALDLARENDARLEMVEVLLGLGNNYVKQGNPEVAIEYLEQARAIGEEIGLNNELSEAYSRLATAYAGISDYRSSFKYLMLKNDIDDVIYRIETDKKLGNMMFSYQLDKKNDEIEILEQQAEIEQLRNRRQKATNIATGSAGIFLLVLAIMFYQRFQYTRRTNAQIQDQKEEIEAQRDQILIQRDLLSSQKQAITDSINYARRIQSAVLPSKAMMDQVMPAEYFVLLKPRDIVSGDFYWVKEVQDHIMIVGADCTGHGVPGAFMSMLGVTLLNDLVVDCSCEKPGQVLGKLRKKVKMMLAHEGMQDYQKDGMDMALMVIDRKKNELQFSGANLPLYLIRNKGKKDSGELDAFSTLTYDGYQLYEIKGDKQPIGTYWEETEFNSYKLKLKEQDTLYIFSDGIIDQYGGSDRKKYKAINFKKLLLSIQPESMRQQKLLIENEFENWRGSFEQIDDVSVIGVRI